MNCEVFIVNMDNKLVICFISTTLERSIGDTDSHSSLESCMLYQRIDSAGSRVLQLSNSLKRFIAGVISDENRFSEPTFLFRYILNSSSE